MQSGEEKVDVGLCVKHGGKGMCVPDYVQAQPDNNGWTYSQALVTVIEQYKVDCAHVLQLFVMWRHMTAEQSISAPSPGCSHLHVASSSEPSMSMGCLQGLFREVKYKWKHSGCAGNCL